MAEYRMNRVDLHRPDVEFENKITIEITGIESKDIAPALFAMKEMLAIPEFHYTPFEMPQLPSFEVPQIPHSPEVPRVESQRQDHSRNSLSRNMPRKAGGQ